MKRIDPAYPDLFPITHVVRPGYLPNSRVSLDPVRMGIVWKDAPRRTLPNEGSVPRHPVRAIAFASVARKRVDVIQRLIDRGGSLLIVLDDPDVTPEDLGVNGNIEPGRLTALVPVLPHPLGDGFAPPTKWICHYWGAVIGLFPFPGASIDVEAHITELKKAGAHFAVTVPLLLTPKDRHRILAGNEGTDIVDQLENALFHADVSRGLHSLERQAGITLDRVGMDPFVHSMVPQGFHPNSVRTAACLRLWARRLDQCQEESSWGWRLRRAASALDCLPQDPHVLAEGGNLRVVPGFDPWVESFTRAVWNGGDAVTSAWRMWSGLDGSGSA